MSNGVRYTAAQRRELEAARLAWLEARERRWASMPLADYLAEARAIDLATGSEFIDFHTRRHAEMRALHPRWPDRWPTVNPRGLMR